MNTDDHAIRAVLDHIPSGVFIMAAHHDGMRSGVLTKLVQPCSFEPPLVMVSIEQGLPIEPLIRDSRSFSLSQMRDGDRLLYRTFRTPPGRGDDPFVTLPSHVAPSGAPIIDRALAAMDCEVMRHVDLDSDHRLYVGRITSVTYLADGALPAIELNGRAVVPHFHGSADNEGVGWSSTG